MQQKEYDSNKERDHWSQPHLVRNIYIPRTRKIKEIFRLHCKVGKRDLQARDEICRIKSLRMLQLTSYMVGTLLMLSYTTTKSDTFATNSTIYKSTILTNKIYNLQRTVRIHLMLHKLRPVQAPSTK